MSTIDGYYFDGRSALRCVASLQLEGEQVTLRRAEQSVTWPSIDLVVAPRTGAPSRLVVLPDGGQFQCADDKRLDRLPQQDPGDGIVAWLEQRWMVALACVAITAAALFAGYQYGLPAVAKQIAPRIPIQSEQSLGNEVLDSMEQFGWISGYSLLDTDRRERLIRRFEAFREGTIYESQLTLIFRSSDVFGANAFALPGGTIVVIDDLVELAETDEEVLAIVAHEIGHIEHRHIIRGLIQNSLVAVAATAVTADAATLTAAVAGLPVVLVQTEYSREFETEADEFAFGLLKDNGISPAAFADMMERLQTRYPDSQNQTLNFLSSHPLMESRIARARAAADGADLDESSHR